VIGAGLAGLLAGSLLRDATVLEQQEVLPNNHSAVLRFRTSIVSDVTGIPFRSVNMVKTTLPWRNPVADALAYSKKNGGIMRSDRSIVSGDDSVTRYIAPPDLTARLATRTKISFGVHVDAAFLHKLEKSIPVVSTMPMPLLMNVLDYPLRSRFQFRHTIGWNINAKIADCDAFVSLLVPAPDLRFSRISITGNELIVEGARELREEDDLVLALHLLGITRESVSDVQIKQQRYAKLEPLDDDDLRREFIFWASSEHNVYSLGRYACWKTKLLIDDLVQDIRLIERWISKRDRYGMKQAMEKRK